MGVTFRQNNASISLTGASISGGDISITAEAKDLGTTDLGDFTKGFVGQLSGLLDQFLGIALSSVTGLDATVQVRASTATVDLLGSTVNAAGTVTITSEAQTDSSVSALALPPSFGPLAGKNAPAIAIGYGQATGTAETTVRGASIITAADDVMVGAQGNVRAKVEARTVANLGLFGADPNGENVSVAIAAAYTNTTVKAQVGQGATVQSTGGDVSILAGGIDAAGKPVTVNNNPSAKTTTYGNGRAGVAVAFGFDITNVDALVDGTVKAAGHAQTVKTIDPATAVNANTNVITLPGHGFGTGQFVKYRTNGGQAIGGLTADTDYQVVRVDADHFYLTQGDAVDIGPGADPLSVHSLAVRATAIVARAGEPFAITVATNMAGRGTDTRSGGCSPDERRIVHPVRARDHLRDARGWRLPGGPELRTVDPWRTGDGQLRIVFRGPDGADGFSVLAGHAAANRSADLGAQSPGRGGGDHR